MDLSKEQDSVLITSITPYFLEKGGVWFQENLKKILEAAKTQQFFQDNTIYIEVGAELGLSQLLRKLDELGYEKVLEVRDMGEFSHQGGMVEFFPINSANAIRIEFVGNRIDSIEQLPIAIEDEEKAKEILQKRLKSQKLFSDLKNLKENEYLVHLDHGVAKFTGFTQILN